MTPYICLIVFIFLLPIFLKVIFKNNINNKYLFLSIIAIFLILSLKSTSVGIDTFGYKSMYDSFFKANWNNYDLYWTEWGYETLEMIFTHFFNFDFYQFEAVLYAFICFSYYNFWKKYSSDYTLSMIIYICFGSFVFDLSGIRNALALAIFLFAVPYIKEKGIKNILKYFAIVLIAAQIHKSAYVCILLFLFVRYSYPIITYLLFPIIVLIFRPLLFPLITVISGKEIATGIQVGGNLFFYIIVLLLPIVFILIKSNGVIRKSVILDSLSSNDLAMKMLYFSILLMLIAGETTLNRIANYGLFFVSTLLPNSLLNLDKQTRIIAKIILYGFLLCYFWIFKLSVNELNMLPYIFH